jgi:hypothetical protein
MNIYFLAALDLSSGILMFLYVVIPLIAAFLANLLDRLPLHRPFQIQRATQSHAPHRELRLTKVTKDSNTSSIPPRASAQPPSVSLRGIPCNS